ncbi:MAG: DUF6429 family protein [Nitrospirae bacterium]|nr:DUF6429 family protein [Nitrospirota bacterium]
MEYDTDKIDDAVLALLALTLGANGDAARAWKGHDWSALDRLHDKGLIHDPRNKNQSVFLTEDGMDRARRLFDEFFGKHSSDE